MRRKHRNRMRRIVAGLALILLGSLSRSATARPEPVPPGSWERPAAPAHDLLPAPSPLVPPTNVLVNEPGAEPLAIVQSEVTLGWEGDRLALLWNDGLAFQQSTVSVCGFGYSTDRGVSWVDGGEVPNATGTRIFGNPSLAVTTAGEWISVTVNFSSAFGLAVNRGRFDGAALVFNPATVYSDGGHVLDRPALGYDADLDRLYLAYRDETVLAGRFAFSDDGGVTWTGIQTLTSGGSPNGLQVSPGPDGVVYASWVDPATTGNGRIECRRSTDGGVTWGAIVQIAQLGPAASDPPQCYNRPNQVPAPAFVVDDTDGPQRGRAYCAYSDGRTGTFDVFLSFSDNGVDWSPAMRLNADATSTEQFWPRLDLGSDGRLTGCWYDRRASSGGNALCDVYAVQTVDGGNVWGPNRRISDTSVTWCGIPANLAPNFGEYLALGSDPRSVGFAWSDARAGGIDVYFARVDDRHGCVLSGDLSGGAWAGPGTAWTIADAVDVTVSPAPVLDAPAELLVASLAFALLASADQAPSLLERAADALSGEVLMGTSAGPIVGSFALARTSPTEIDLSFSASSGTMVADLIPSGPWSARLQIHMEDPGVVALFGRVDLSTTAGPEVISVYAELAVPLGLVLEHRWDYDQVGEFTFTPDLRLRASTRVARRDGAPTEAPIPEASSPRRQGVSVTALPNPEPHRVVFTLPEPSPVELWLLDAQGRLLRKLVDRSYGAGMHSLPFDPRTGGDRRLPAGSYFLSLRASQGGARSKFVLLPR